MRATDIHTSVTIDEEKRIILLTGAIDDTGYVINMRIPVPSEGDWTVVKAETNLTDKPWATWQMVFDENVELVLKNGEPEVLTSQNFDNARYIPSKNVVVFYGGEPIRPGETILKTFKVNTKVKEICASHAARVSNEHPDYLEIISGQKTNETLPRFEMEPIIKTKAIPEVFELDENKKEVI